MNWELFQRDSCISISRSCYFKHGIGLKTVYRIQKSTAVVPVLLLPVGKEGKMDIFSSVAQKTSLLPCLLVIVHLFSSHSSRKCKVKRLYKHIFLYRSTKISSNNSEGDDVDTTKRTKPPLDVDGAHRLIESCYITDPGPTLCKAYVRVPKPMT